jgi:hypothetical protein
MSDIWKRSHELDKERRDLISKLMEPYEEYFRVKRKALMDDCEAEGHNFKFTDFGPLGHAWFHCSKCGRSKVEDND